MRLNGKVRALHYLLYFKYYNIKYNIKCYLDFWGGVLTYN